MLAIGLAMIWDLPYRIGLGGRLAFHPSGPLLAVAGAWILLWWPLARRPRPVEDA
jgi:hypothetical protein